MSTTVTENTDAGTKGANGVTIVRAIQAKHFRVLGMNKHFARDDGDPIPADLHCGTIIGLMTGHGVTTTLDPKTGEERQSVILTGSFEANTADGKAYQGSAIYIPGSAFADLAVVEFNRAKAATPGMTGIQMALSVDASYTGKTIPYGWKITSHTAATVDPLAEMRRALTGAGFKVRQPVLAAPASDPVALPPAVETVEERGLGASDGVVPAELAEEHADAGNAAEKRARSRQGK